MRKANDRPRTSQQGSSDDPSKQRAFERRKERFADKFNYTSRTSDSKYSLKERPMQQELLDAIQLQVGIVKSLIDRHLVLKRIIIMSCPAIGN
jgi:hypothetical protein